MGKIMIRYDTVSNSIREAAEIIYNELKMIENGRVDLAHYKRGYDE